LEEAVVELANICKMVTSNNPDNDLDFIAWKMKQITNPIAADAVKEAGR
jgi:hypothetical protein